MFRAILAGYVLAVLMIVAIVILLPDNNDVATTWLESQKAGLDGSDLWEYPGGAIHLTVREYHFVRGSPGEVWIDGKIWYIAAGNKIIQVIPWDKQFGGPPHYGKP